MNRMFAAVAASVVGGLVATALVGSPTSATTGACTSSDGVTVIVDATALGGGLSQKCALDRPISGLDALRKAGFSWTPVSAQPAMVCRIDGRPGSADQSCVNSPPANAYWGYFRANRGGEWKYSSVGASAATIPGGVEGWVFLTGDRRPPGLKPPAAIERNQSIAPTKSATAKPSKSVPSSSAPQNSAAAGAAKASAKPNVPAPTAAAPSTPVPVGADVNTAPTDTAVTTDVTNEAVVSPSGGGGSALTALVGVVLLAGLVLAAVVLGARRRRSS